MVLSAWQKVKQNLNMVYLLSSVNKQIQILIMFLVISRCQKHSHNLFISWGSIQISSGGQKLICLRCVLHCPNSCNCPQNHQKFIAVGYFPLLCLFMLLTIVLQHCFCICETDQCLIRWFLNWFHFFSGVWGIWTSISSFLTCWSGFGWTVSGFANIFRFFLIYLLYFAWF